MTAGPPCVSWPLAGEPGSTRPGKEPMTDYRRYTVSGDERLYDVRLTLCELVATSAALLGAVAGTHISNGDTWHGGLGADACALCSGLLEVRAAIGIQPADYYRPR